MSWLGDSEKASPLATIGAVIFVAAAVTGWWVQANYAQLSAANENAIGVVNRHRARERQQAQDQLTAQARSACEMELRSRYLECEPPPLYNPIISRQGRVDLLLPTLQSFRTRCGNLVQTPTESDVYAYCGIGGVASQYPAPTYAYRDNQEGKPENVYGEPYVVSSRPATPVVPAWEIESPRWARAPDADRILRNYPRRALERGQGGRAVLLCTSDAGGNLACEVESEEPTGWGFGQAALRATRDARLARTDETGRSVVGGTVRIPIVFQTADER